MTVGKFGCIHYRGDLRKWIKCDNPLWIDENGHQHKRCQEHICVFCHKNVKSKNKKDKEIGKNNKGSLYFCDKKKECIDKKRKVETENAKVQNELINIRDSLFDNIKANSLVDAEFPAGLRSFFVELWEKQIFLLGSNYFETPAFTLDMLETIKGIIEGVGFLSEREKSDLKMAYTKAPGNIDSTISEVEENLTNIGKSRKLKKDLEKLSVERGSYVKKLEDLEGWDLLSGSEKVDYLQQIKSSSISSLGSVLSGVQKLVSLYRERERERDKLKNLSDWNLLSADQQQNFLAQINNSSSSDQFKNIFEQVNQAIKKAKDEQALLAKKTLVTQEINQYLLTVPVINASELGGSNSNWVSEIKGVSNIALVNQIKARVWASATAKKTEKKLEKELSDLIQEAQASRNSNLLDKLQKDLEKINAYRNKSVFQKRKKEVEDLENFLFSANLSKYREFIVNSLQKELASEPFPVLVEELKENNRDFVTQVNQLADRPALENVKNSVLNNVGEKRAEKLVDNLLTQIEKDFDSEEDRSIVCQEIYRLRDNGNNWEKELWESKRDIFEEFLKGEKKKDSSNYDNSNSKPSYFWPILAVLLVSGMIITGFFLVIRGKLKRFLLSFLKL